MNGVEWSQSGEEKWTASRVYSMSSSLAVCQVSLGHHCSALSVSWQAAALPSLDCITPTRIRNSSRETRRVVLSGRSCFRSLITMWSLLFDFTQNAQLPTAVLACPCCVEQSHTNHLRSAPSSTLTPSSSSITALCSYIRCSTRNTHTSASTGRISSPLYRPLYLSRSASIDWQLNSHVAAKTHYQSECFDSRTLLELIMLRPSAQQYRNP